jgi:molybdopterin-guanine dinucleotide biosynthesis protein A
MTAASASLPHEAVLLAGGRSRRMGQDKIWLRLRGRPLWERQWQTLERTRPRRLRISLAAGQPSPRPEIDIVRDRYRDRGPISGLVGALRVCRAPRLLVLATDLPFMTSSYLRGLLRAGRSGVGVVPACRHDYEPLAAVYPIGMLPLAEAHLRRRRYDLQSLIRAGLRAGLMVAQPLTGRQASLFRNINTPADWRHAKRRR